MVILDLDDLEATAKAATPGPWHQGAHYIGAGGEPYDPEAVVGQASILCDAEHIAAFDPPTVLTLIAKLREAESVIEAARESEARTKFIAWGRKPTHGDSSHTWRILTAYKPTNQEGGNDGT